MIQPNASYATIGGGYVNTIKLLAHHANIGGGYANTIDQYAEDSTIDGGYYNTIQPNAFYATIGGGFWNTIQTNASYATIGGGYGNSATNTHATVAGGAGNLAGGVGSFPAGQNAKAIHDGALVWCDNSFLALYSTNANSVTMRGAGGYRLFSNSGTTAGVYLAPGGGSWTSMSDRHAKENLRAVNAQAVLAKVATLPLSTWNYTSQAPSIRHLGPMAQDFAAAFGVGETDTGISTVDADGVALAAIQGLNQKLEEKSATLEKEVAELKALVKTLAEKVNGGAR
jgi:hypothetical protein